MSEKRVYRTFGAPRTFVTLIEGSDCGANSTVAAGCGLNWAAVILIDWVEFFAEWYQERDLSLMIFTILLVLQLHLVQVLMHSSLRYVEETHGKQDSSPLDEPTYETATEELAQVPSGCSASML